MLAPLNKTLTDKDVKGTICTSGRRYFGKSTVQLTGSVIDAGMEGECFSVSRNRFQFARIVDCQSGLSIPPQSVIEANH